MLVSLYGEPGDVTKLTLLALPDEAHPGRRLARAIKYLRSWGFQCIRYEGVTVEGERTTLRKLAEQAIDIREDHKLYRLRLLCPGCNPFSLWDSGYACNAQNYRRAAVNALEALLRHAVELAGAGKVLLEEKSPCQD